MITANDLQKQTLIEHGISGDKISVIMNVGNPAIFQPQRYIGAENGLTLAYHGTVARRLGVDLILNAIRQARAKCPNLRFLLLGEGEDMPVVRRLVNEYELNEVVELKGWVPVEDLPTYLSAVDVGIVGNRCSTQTRKNWMLPVKMLEYAAMEIPTIAPRLRVINHYFDETSAFFYTPDDAEDMARRIAEIYECNEKIEAAKMHLRRFNQKYNWKIMQDRYLELITDLLSGGNGVESGY